MGDFLRKSNQRFQGKVGNWKIYNVQTSTGNEKELQDKHKKRPRTIALRVAKLKDQRIMLKNVNKVKESDFYINEDFSWETTKLKKKLLDEVKQLRLEGKFALLNYLSIITRDQGKKQFDQIINF